MAFTLRGYQQTSVDKCMDYINGKSEKPGLLIAPTGCHAKGRKILMYNGHLKDVEDIKVGELLMGNDSSPREVLQLCRGFGDMYRIKLKSRIEFIVNGDHILHLVRSGNSDDPHHNNTYPLTTDISVRDYLLWAKSRKHLYKIYRTGVDFSESKDELPIDPYFLGLWLGDGSKGSPSITTMDEEVVDFLAKFAEEQDLNFVKKLKKGSKASTYSLTKRVGFAGKQNHLLELLRSEGLTDKKHIPHKYMVASREDRLKLLAGLIDTDTYMGKPNSYIFTQKCESLSRQVYALANSLGFIASFNRKMKGCTNCEDKSLKEYFDIGFRGDSTIPCRVARRISYDREFQKSNNMSGFDIERIEDDNYYGFHLSGNHLYLDEDFIVHHNSGKSLLVAEVANRVEEPVLVIQPTKELLEQNYEKFTSIGGVASIYSASLKSKEISHITFGTLQSLIGAISELKKMNFGLVLIDECHFKCPPDPGSMFMRLITALKPRKVIGMTATPVYLKSSMEGAELKFLTRMRPAYFKDVIHCIQIQEMIQNGFWSKLYYQVDKFNDDILELNSNGSDFTERSIVAAVEELKVNNKIYLKIKELRASGYKRILVFMDSVANAERMHQYIPGSAVVFGKTPKKERESSINGFKDGSIDVLLNVSCLTTGFDVPEMDAIILGSATNSLALYYQMIGRGVRIHPNKDHCLIIDYLGNVNRFGVVETLEIIDYEYSGWGIFNNNILLSNAPMGGLKKTKEDLRIDFLNKEKKKNKEKLPDVILMPFGKHKGLPIESVPISYLKFILTPQPGRDEFNWNCNAFYREVKKKIDTVLARQTELTNTLRVN